MTSLSSNIKKSTLLNTIPDELFQDFVKRSLLKISTYKKGQIIHFDGDICKSMEIILDGKVAVERIDEAGDLFTITEFYPDDVLGGSLIFSTKPHYPMTISARTNVTILEIKKDILLDFCFSNKEFLCTFLQLISDNTLLLGDKIKHYANRSIRDCICAYLRQEYQLQNTLKIALNTTKKALAERIGVQRTSLSRELQKMKQEGIIEYDSVSITILDQKILR